MIFPSENVGQLTADHDSTEHFRSMGVQVAMSLAERMATATVVHVHGNHAGAERYLAREDHAGTRTSERLVSGGCDNVAVLKGLVSLLRCHQATASQSAR